MDPGLGVSQTGDARVLRGGSWYYEEGGLRSIFRFGVIPVEFLVRSTCVFGWSRYMRIPVSMASLRLVWEQLVSAAP